MNDNHLFENIYNIENKCSELISEINQHLSVKEMNVDKENTTEINKKNVCDGRKEEAMNTQSKLQENENGFANSMLLTCHQKIINFSCNRAKVFPPHNAKCIKEVCLSREICCKLTKINQSLDEIVLNTKQEKSVFSQIKNDDKITKKLNVQYLQHVDIKPSLRKQVAFSLNVAENEKDSKTSDNVATFKCVHNSPSTILKTEINRSNTENSHCSLNKEYESCEKRKPSDVENSRGNDLKDSLNKNEGQKYKNQTEKGLRKNLTTENLRTFLFGDLKSGEVPKKRHVTAAVSIKTKKDFYKKKTSRKNLKKLKIKENISSIHNSSSQCEDRILNK